ncbi:Myc-type basic helix-loop-helix (bHLH) domain [Arabidopsis suecica]|uniref:Myc-type basic helix-loop-helix (BHLH) domain n=1 Tax=Arabidopsis suecica TaxID=45249 RepID=A0A8T2H0P6_ARASU|nr:Myc-type basic helix-loop-helix (bHLH) domain [Arabidopsis suecica]
MVESLFPSIENTSESSPESRRKKPRISKTAEAEAEIESRRINEESLKRWKTNRVQQIYASKLVEALRRVRQRSSTDTDTDKVVSGAAREIRETADRVLAASARGTTRWSRAILASRVRAKLKKHRKAKKSNGNCKSRKGVTETNRIKLPAVERKLKILGRLVPGCRKVSVPNLLDEATDYIAALEMQVRAMEALAELLTAAAPRTTLTGT